MSPSVHDKTPEEKLQSYLESQSTLLYNDPPAIIKAIEHYALARELSIVSPHKSDIVARELNERRARTVVEVDGYVAYSAVYLVNSVLASDNFSDITYYLLESDEDTAKVAKYVVELAGYADHIKVLVGSPVKTLVHLAESEDFTVDFLYLNNWPDSYVPDLRVAESLGLISHGTVVGAEVGKRLEQDFFVERYMEYVRGSPAERRKFISDHVNFDNNESFPGRWNVLYETRVVTAQASDKHLVALSVCTDYLDS